MNYKILDALDNISESMSDASISVMNSLIHEYDKISLLTDNEIFVEGKILDDATGVGKVESGLKKVLMFLPRLLISIVQSIGNLLTGNKPSEAAEKLQQLSSSVNTMDQTELQQVANATNSVSKDIQFDPTKKTFFLSNKFRSIRNKIFIVVGLSPVYKKIAAKIKYGGDTGYEPLIRELKEVLKGNKELDMGTAELTSDMLKKVMEDGTKASLGIRGISDELSRLIEQKLKKDYNNGKELNQKYLQLKDLCDNVTIGAKHVSHVLGFLSIGSKICDRLGTIKRFIKKKFGVTPEDADLNNAKSEETELNAEYRRQKEKYKDASFEYKQNEKMRRKIAKQEKKNQKLAKKIEKKTEKADEQRRITDADNAIYDMGRNP